MRDRNRLDGDFLNRVADTKNPQELSDMIYRLCVSAAAVKKIDLICNEKLGRTSIACFVETPSMQEARQLARHLGVTLFGEHGLIFDLPRPDGFQCAHYSHHGDAALPARVAFNCLVR